MYGGKKNAAAVKNYSIKKLNSKLAAADNFSVEIDKTFAALSKSYHS